jgi:hypothetical protein
MGSGIPLWAKSPHHPERNEVMVRDPALPPIDPLYLQRHKFGRCGILATSALTSFAEVAGRFASEKEAKLGRGCYFVAL